VFDRDGTNFNGDDYDNDDGDTAGKHAAAVSVSGSSGLFRGSKPSSASNSLSKDNVGWSSRCIFSAVTIVAYISGYRLPLHLNLLTYFRPE
jgi:hypothetical protein